MSLNVSQFERLANSAFFQTSTLDVKADGDTPRLSFRGVFSFGNHEKANDATMSAFRDALKREYGVCGVHAFDTVLGERAMLHEGLRARDVKCVLASLPSVHVMQVQNEFLRLLDTSPRTMGDVYFQERCRTAFLEEIKHLPDLLHCKALLDVKELARMLFDTVTHGQKRTTQLPTDTVLDRFDNVKPKEPMGLKGVEEYKFDFSETETSVEDRINSGNLGVGMCINLGNERPMLLDKLKTQGVEPGFICRNDWSRNDTSSLLQDVHGAAAQRTLPDHNPADHKSLCLAGLQAGRTNPASIAFAAEYLLDLALSGHAFESDAGKKFAVALKSKFPGMTAERLFGTNGAPTNEQKELLKQVKCELFAELREAVMNGKDEPAVSQFGAFRHFSDRNIVKLDYNESNKSVFHGAGSCGKFRLPLRYKARYNAAKGVIKRTFNLTTAKSASIGAVGEALANDLTRLCGVPAQDMTITRGKYSDGNTKLMLSARFKNGYHDFGGNFLKDGRLVPFRNEKGEVEMPEDIGRFKAIFLLLGDRDAIGKRAGNKGMVNGTFFAIDPGHSLEGIGQELDIRDDLSFKDTQSGIKTKLVGKRFANFSVFDDSTRAEKFKGILTIRDVKASGTAKRLFDSYLEHFDPRYARTEADKELYAAICSRVKEMRTEFDAQMERMLKVFEPQLKLYDALNNSHGQKTAESALNLIEAFEKATSPTTASSKNKQVELKHLEVIPKTRVPWTASVQGDGRILFSTNQKLSPQALKSLKMLIPEFDHESVKGGMGFTLSADQLPQLLAQLSDANIRENSGMSD